MSILRSALFFIFLLVPVLLIAREINVDITNNTDHRITGLTLIEKGTSRRIPLFIGRGVSPGATVTVVWATFEGDCTWSAQAKFDTGAETRPIPINFCVKPEIIFEK